MGKLSKDTTEADVKEHFMRFGYVLDVYLPRGEGLGGVTPFGCFDTVSRCGCQPCSAACLLACSGQRACHVHACLA